VVFVATLPTLGFAQGEPQDSLDAQLQQCDSCHAPAARIRSIAPVLNGLPRGYLKEQMENFLSGQRGGKDTDHFITQMIGQLADLPPSAIEKLARHYARQPAVMSEETVRGDAAAGEPLFEEHCAGCHNSTMGRLFTRSPPIAQLNGTYLLAQLQSFANGQRSFSKSGKHKTRMVEVAKRFNQQELLNITAAIKQPLIEKP
jgi:cytochrome c553